MIRTLTSLFRKDKRTPGQKLIDHLRVMVDEERAKKNTFKLMLSHSVRPAGGRVFRIDYKPELKRTFH